MPVSPVLNREVLEKCLSAFHLTANVITSTPGMVIIDFPRVEWYSFLKRGRIASFKDYIYFRTPGTLMMVFTTISKDGKRTHV